MQWLLVVTLLFLPSTTLGHAFGQQYTLPLPVPFYIVGGVGAFLASCLMLVLTEARPFPTVRTFRLSRPVYVSLVWIARVAGLGLLAYGLYAGLVNGNAVEPNALTYLFWIGLVLIIPYVCALISGWWNAFNPFRLIARAAGFPETRNVWKHGYLPALIGYVLLILLELFYPWFGTDPSFLVLLLATYSIYLLVGSAMYGTRTWFRYADLFTVFVALAGSLAPVRAEGRTLSFVSPTEKLVRTCPKSITLLLFIIFALAATAFDGFSETVLMESLVIYTLDTPWRATTLAFFVAFPFLFYALYAGAITMMRRLVKAPLPLRHYLLRFALSLVPILLAYHFAHYFPLLFATSGLVIGADLVWNIQLIVIVLGHTYAAYLAHRTALLEFGEPKHALLSQVPMLVLMICYTAFGLWVLAQPFAG